MGLEPDQLLRCLSVNASDVVIESLWIFDCPTEPVAFEFGSGSGNTMANCYVSGSGPATFYGDGTRRALQLLEQSRRDGHRRLCDGRAEILAESDRQSRAAAGIFVDNDAGSVFLLKPM